MLTYAVPVGATPITGGVTGLASPTSTITFDELGNLQNQIITNQFAPFGLASLTGGWWDNASLGQAGSTGFAGGDLVSGTVGGSVSPTPMVLTFSTALSGAAFAMVDQNATFTISAYLGGTGGTLVETFNIAVGTNPGVGFVGFQNILFDTISITPLSAGSHSIDTLQVSSAVPEPGTLLLLGTGVALIAARRLKRRS